MYHLEAGMYFSINFFPCMYKGLDLISTTRELPPLLRNTSTYSKCEKKRDGVREGEKKNIYGKCKIW